MSIRKFLAIALTMVAPALAAEGLRPAAADEILSGTQSCIAATSAAGLDLRRLETDGWAKGTMSANGKSVATPLTFYGKGHLMLIINSADPKPFCILTARLSSAREFRNLQAAFASKFGVPAKDDGKGEQMFFPPNDHIIDLASTGSAESPAVRVAVGPVLRSSK